MASVAAPALKAPFPYAGGKARVAADVWGRFGDVDNYVEPFAGSLAVLLRRPAGHFRSGYRVETVNDLNHYLVNFWRAVAADPAAVAGWADWPVTEADLHARHKWLVRSREAAEFRERVRADPHHFDAKIAGWWVWGQCCWIGGAWCNDIRTDHGQIPGQNADGRGYGVNRGDTGDTGDRRKMPNLGQECSTGGVGVHGVGGPTDWQQPPDMDGGRGRLSRPQLADAIGRGVNSGGSTTDHARRPCLAGTPTSGGMGYMSYRNATDAVQAGVCEARSAWLTGWMRRLADRLRLVRTCYGHWSRVCDSDSTLTRLGVTGVFLDPPYPARRADTGAKSRDAALYATDKGADLDALRDEVLGWCRKWGASPSVRAAVCGYEGDGYESLAAAGWAETAWEANGGYGNQRRGGKGKSENARRERIWFSPHCLKPDGGPNLFTGLEG